MMSALSLSKNRLETQITAIRGGFRVSSCLPVLETTTLRHDETVRREDSVSSVTVSTVLRDQMWIRRLGSVYKNTRMFTRREGAGVETPRLDAEPWIRASAPHMGESGLGADFFGKSVGMMRSPTLPDQFYGLSLGSGCLCGVSFTPG